jgi:hypothetical protein
MIYCKKGKTFTTEKILEEMHLQWHLAGGKSKDNKDSNNEDEIALAAMNASLEKLGDWVTARTQFGHKVGRKSGAFNPATGTTVKWADRVVAISVDVPDDNYNNVLGVDKDEEKVFEDNHNELIEYIILGAGIGGGFSNTQEL